MRKTHLLRTLEAAAVLLFFLQTVRVLFSVLFGVIYDAIFEETIPLSAAGGILLAVILALLTPLFVPRTAGRRFLLATAVTVAVARIGVTANQPWVRLWSSLAVIAVVGLYVATLSRRQGSTLAPALIGALAADQFLRTAGDTFDLALRAWWIPVQALLAGGVAYLGRRLLREEPEAEPSQALFDWVGGLGWGALLFLETALLDFPNGIARWSGTPYEIAAPLLMTVTLLPLVEPVRLVAARLLRRPLGGMVLLFLSLSGLAAGRLVGGAVGLIGLLLAQFLLLLAVWGDKGRGDHKGRPYGVGLLLFLVLHFAFAFTFTYPYTIPAFRGMGLPILLVATFVAALPALRSEQPVTRSQQPAIRSWLPAVFAILLTVLFAWPRPLTYRENGPIRAGTYNIHYGYNTTWQLSLEAQARTIEESGADVVMLQEVDTCRITSYGIDNALWLARRLGMQAIYQPTLENLSGIALLTRFPVTTADGALLTSELEQTGIVHARLQIGGQEVDAYGVWLGLEPEERARQLTDALAYMGDASPALLGGDLNSTPESPIYTRLAAAGFTDPFTALGLGNPPTSPAIRPHHRIDFVWGRGLEPTDAAVLDSLASDHRMVITEWKLP